MADTYTTNLNLTKPEPGAAEDTWGISLNSDLDALDAIFSSSGTQINLNPNQINFADNKKAIFGTGSDLEIYHDGSNSYIDEAGSGGLYIRANSFLTLQKYTGENLAQFFADSEVRLFYDNAQKLATKSTGIDVTGTVTSDGLIVSNLTGSVIKLESTGTGLGADTVIGDLQFFGNDASTPGAGVKASITATTVASLGDDAQLMFSTSNGTTNNINRLLIANNGDISFYDDTGTSQALFWDASAETLAIGHTSPSSTYRLDVAGGIRSFGNAPSYTLREDDASSQTWLMASYGGTFAVRDITVAGTAYPFQIEAATPSNTLYLDSTGKAGIGTSSPSEKLEVAGGGFAVTGNSIKTIIAYSDRGIFGTTTNHDLEIRTNNTERMRIDSSGNLLLGATSTAGDAKFYLKNGSSGQSYSNVSGMLIDVNGTSNSYYGLRVGSSTGNSHLAVTNAGNVGIGTSNPRGKLDITGSDSTNGTKIISEVTSTDISANNNASFSLYEIGTEYGRLQRARDGLGTIKLSALSTQHLQLETLGTGTLRFVTNSAERMRIDSSGNVGIGTTSPARILDVNGTARLADGSSLEWGGVSANIAGSSSTDTLFFRTASTERMRLDSSGNLLVGTTVTSVGIANTYEGISIKGEGRLFASVDGDYPLNLNRNTSDGTIANFRKDGTAVGSIGTNSGALYISSPYGNDSGLRFVSNIIAPATTTGANRDAAIDLGYSSGRFKDLYLSGGLRGDTTFKNNAGTTEYGRFDSSGNFGIGTTNPTAPLHISSSDNITAQFHSTDSLSEIFISDNSSTASITNNVGILTLCADRGDTLSGSMIRFQTDTATRMIVDASGNVGIGTTSPACHLEVSGSGNGSVSDHLRITSTDTQAKLAFVTTTGNGAIYQNGYDLVFATNTANTERMRITSSGELLLNKTSASVGTDGVQLRPSSYSGFSATSTTALFVNRNTDDGDVVEIGKNGVKVGTIGTVSNRLHIGSGNTFVTFYDTGNSIYPAQSNGTLRDNAIDIGTSSGRFQDIYATNGTIQTSDINEKQDIEELSEAETRVAVAAKGLLKKYRWKSAVADKGDDARIHFGIMAQDLQQAFSAEGLDAGDYGMFISSTWTDETTGEEKTRLGVRYNELLAFIIAAI